jgi:hypothetical protein
MSNPLLRPNDPRFRKPDIRDAEGKNQFADGRHPADEAQTKADLYAAAATDDPRPYEPKYEVHQQPRSGLLLVLGSVGWVGAVMGTLSLIGIFDSGWICPLLGLGPAAAAWLLGYEDLKAIEVGALDEPARPETRLATWIGFLALVACLSIVGWMIYRQMNFLPDLF